IGDWKRPATGRPALAPKPVLPAVPNHQSSITNHAFGESKMTKQIQDAYIVAATRTPVGKAPKGVFRNTRPDDMLAHVLKAVIAQAPGVDVGRIEDAI